MDEACVVSDVQWANLEIDILVCIFQKLEEKDRLIGVPLVCRAWYRASKDPLYWKHLDLERCYGFNCQIDGWSYLEPHKFLEFVLEKRRGVIHSIVFPSMFTTETLLLSIANRSPNIESVVFLDCRQLKGPEEEYKALCEAVSKWPLLKSITMDASDCLPKSFWRELERCCTNLSTVKIRGVTLAGKEVAHIVGHLRGIKALILDLFFINKEHVVSFLSSCKKLEHFVLRCHVGFEMDIEFLNLASGINFFRVIESPHHDDSFL
ncbi:hypothetical protein AMTRI_Chr10g5860 [Amborella trichopoda]